MKFKAGDKVVVVRLISGAAVYSIGDKFEISKVYSYEYSMSNGIKSRIVGSTTSLGAYDCDIELEVIYDSPLYKALS